MRPRSPPVRVGASCISASIRASPRVMSVLCCSHWTLGTIAASAVAPASQAMRGAPRSVSPTSHAVSIESATPAVAKSS